MQIFLITLLLISGLTAHKSSKMTTDDKIIIDSKVTLEEALTGKEIPEEILKDVVLVDVQYYSTDRKLHHGQLVVHKELADDIIAIFKKIKQKKFPVEKVIPVNKFDWDDNKSMDANNTSAFNYRTIAGTKTMSKHALGRAIDINPFLNPEIVGDRVSPKGSSYNENIPGTIKKGSWLVLEFKTRGWKWGGDWIHKKDYQHFEKQARDVQ